MAPIFPDGYAYDYSPDHSPDDYVPPAGFAIQPVAASQQPQRADAGQLQPQHQDSATAPQPVGTTAAPRVVIVIDDTPSPPATPSPLRPKPTVPAATANPKSPSKPSSQTSPGRASVAPAAANSKPKRTSTTAKMPKPTRKTTDRTNSPNRKKPRMLTTEEALANYKAPASHSGAAGPPSVEAVYREKCKAIKKRINDIEASNEQMHLRVERAKRSIQRMRMERALLLERLGIRSDAMEEEGSDLDEMSMDDEMKEEVNKAVEMKIAEMKLAKIEQAKKKKEGMATHADGNGLDDNKGAEKTGVHKKKGKEVAKVEDETDEKIHSDLAAMFAAMPDGMLTQVPKSKTGGETTQARMTG